MNALKVVLSAMTLALAAIPAMAQPPSESAPFATEFPRPGAVEVAEQLPLPEISPAGMSSPEPFAYSSAAKAFFKARFGKECQISGIWAGLRPNMSDYTIRFYLHAPRALSVMADTMEVGVKADGTVEEIKTGTANLLLMQDSVDQGKFKVSLAQARKAAEAAGLTDLLYAEIFGTTYSFSDGEKTVDVSAKTGQVLQ